MTLNNIARKYPRTITNETSAPSGGCSVQIRAAVNKKQILQIKATRDKNLMVRIRVLL